MSLTESSVSFTPEQIRQFFEAHLGPLPYRDQVALRCIFHDDHSPSLSINLQKGVWKCHAGCGEGGLLDFQMRLTPGADRQSACALVNEACGANVLGGKKAEAIYHYTDAQGQPLFQKLRFRNQNGEKYFVYRHWTLGGYAKGAEGITKPLYKLPSVLIANDIFITEGEKNADDLARALESVVQGEKDVHVAVTTSHGGAGCWSDDYNPYFLGKRVIILADNDDPGHKHAERVAVAIHPFATGVKILNLSGLGEGGDVSDYLATHPISDLLEEARKARLWCPASSAPVWRTAFRSYDELKDGEPEFLIDKVLPQGITFLGGLPATGKSWLALSMAKAITSGQKFLQNFKVPHPLPVIYLNPETNDQAFRKRLRTMRMTFPEDLLLVRTMGSGPTLGLDSAELIDAARALQPVIVLDTTVRFITVDDENSAAQNRKLSNEMFNLLQVGAKGIIAIHHSRKDAKDGKPSLESALRGTSDYGAMCEACYELRCGDRSTLTIDVTCVKNREEVELPPFQIQGRPYLNDIGDFAMIAQLTDQERVALAINADRHANVREIAYAAGVGVNRVTLLANAAGWEKEAKEWMQQPSVLPPSVSYAA